MAIAAESFPVRIISEKPVVKVWEVPSFAQAVDRAIALTPPRAEAVDVVGLLDLDGTYKKHKLLARERREDRAQRTEAFTKLLETQHPAEVVVWTARPKLLIPRRIRRELETIALEHDTPLHYIAGPDKWGEQKRFQREIGGVLERHASAHWFVFGDSIHDRRGVDHVAPRVNGPVHHFQVGPLRRI